MQAWLMIVLLLMGAAEFLTDGFSPPNAGVVLVDDGGSGIPPRP